MASKYRPYLTATELSEIILALKQTNKSPILIHYLESYVSKAELGVTKPNLQTKPTVIESLELDTSATHLGISLEAQRLAAYNKWLANPGKCSSVEIARVAMYRYENDLMSAQEESEYESKIDKGY